MSGPRWQYSAGEFVAVTKQRRAELAAALGEIRKNRAIHQQSRAEVEASYRTALSELVQTLVPSLDPQTLAWAAWATGFAPLGQPSFLAAMEDERQKLTAHVAALEADPRYRDRELLRAPRVGTLTRQIEELEQYRAPLAEVVERCAHPRLEHLIEVGYGTPEYAVGFWRTAYYADWKAGDEILARFPERKTFAEVLRGYLEARDACVVYDAKIAELEAEVAEGERLESEHDKAKQALETISSRYVGHAREALGRHLSEIDLGAIGPRLAAAPQVEILAKRVAGLVAKAVYLDRLAHQHLDLPEAEMTKALAKLDRDILKYSRPKMAFAQVPAPTFEQRSQSLAPRFSKGHQRFQKSYTRVYVFNDYDHGRLAQDFLWWDLMTDGRIDGNFIPEVDEFHQRHPSYVYQAPAEIEDRDDLVAAAAIADVDVPDHDDTNLNVVDAS